MMGTKVVAAATALMLLVGCDPSEEVQDDLGVDSGAPSDTGAGVDDSGAVPDIPPPPDLGTTADPGVMTPPDLGTTADPGVVSPPDSQTTPDPGVVSPPDSLATPDPGVVSPPDSQTTPDPGAGDDGVASAPDSAPDAGSGGCVDDLDCDDGDPCTVDSCDEEVGCVYATAADGTPCGTQPNAACSAGACVCEPDCEGVACGPGSQSDGCGGYCEGCPAGWSCWGFCLPTQCENLPTSGFNNSILEDVLREALGLPFGDLLPDYFLSFTYLDVSGLGLGSLTGVECVLGLKDLRASSNNISSLAPLVWLPKLTHLDVAQNNVANLAPLTDLTALGTLDLRNNLVTDITPLVDNAGLADGDTVKLEGNPLDCSAQAANLSELVDRGVVLTSDCP